MSSIPQPETDQNLLGARTPADSPVQTWRVYAMAAIYLLAGLAMGYVLRMSQASTTAAGAVASASTPHGVAGATTIAKAPSLDEMRQMAEDRAKPLLEKLKSDPNNSALLMQLGSLYHEAHQFKEAAAYYNQAAQADSKNLAARNKLAISLYRQGDADGAIAQLNLALKDNPGDADLLFNLGMIRLQGKQDSAGALAAWQKLLKMNPRLSDDRKAEVQKLMADVETSHAAQNRNPQERNQGARQ